MEGKVFEVRNFLLWGGGTLVWDHQVGVVGLAAAVLTRGCVLLRLPSSQLRGCCGFGLRLLRPGRLPGGDHFRLLGSFRDRLGRGIWNTGWWGSGLDNTPPRTTLFHHLPRSICSTEGPARCSFVAVRWAVAAFFWPRSGACFASAAFASFHFTQPR